MARRPDAYSCNRTVLSELERRLCGRAGPGAVACGGSPQMPGAGRGRGTGEIGCRMSPSDVTRVPNFAIACALNKRAPRPRPPAPPRPRVSGPGGFGARCGAWGGVWALGARRPHVRSGAAPAAAPRSGQPACALALPLASPVGPRRGAACCATVPTRAPMRNGAPVADRGRLGG